MEIEETYEEGLEALRKIPISNEDAIQTYLREEAIQNDMYLIDEPHTADKQLGKDWWKDLIEDN